LYAYLPPTRARPLGCITGSIDLNYEGLRRWGTSTVDEVVDQNWVTFSRDPASVLFADSSAPTFLNGRVVAIALDGAADCASADVRARVDSKEVRNRIKSQIDRRFPF
jgi:hypothetical protein